mgnify:CR=1 FL=1|tara:strand:- start:32 stop:262 length:231 start_codon:yes stop_codon:yes gene_type:complete
MRDTRQQPMAEHGDLISPFNNRVLTQTEVDAYNRYTLDFNRFTYTAEKEFMLDQRHRYVVLCFNQKTDFAGYEVTA